ncbi:MAG: hypothetical protein HYX41_05775 [Bdellovibrio sp.]|nr:hypothetical protein [Bdellovibrio sp.]
MALHARKGIFGLVAVLAFLVGVRAGAVLLTPEQEADKKKVAEFQKNLEPLDPWQRKIFQEEVIPQFQKFFTTGTGPVTLNEERIRQYLTFYGPKATQAKDPKFLLYLGWDDTCEKCRSAERIIRPLVRGRVTRRGFQPAWVERSEVDVPLTESPEKLDHKLVEQMGLTEAVGALSVQWGPAEKLGVKPPPVVSDDPEAEAPNSSEGSQTVPMALRVSLRLGERTLNKAKVVQESEKFESETAGFLNDFFVELALSPRGSSAATAAGEKTNSQAADLPAGTSEVAVRITGVRDFIQLVRIKNQFQNQIKDVLSVAERKISKSQITLAIRAKLAEPQLIQQIETLALDPEHDKGLKKEIER